VCSKDKIGLCKENNFEHKTNLKEDNAVYDKQSPMPEVHRDILEGQIKVWLKMGIIQPSRSKFNCPLFMAQNKDISLRIVQDCCLLNTKSQDDRYSTKDIKECKKT
jgi:hypothetical protein